MSQKVNIKKLNPNACIPTYGTEFSAGADLYSGMSEAVTVMPGTTEFIKTGIAMEIPTGLVGLIYARSGMACKKGLAPANKVGVIDSDYRGEIIVALHNHSDKPVTIELETKSVEVAIKAGQDGRVFGSVSTKEIATAAKEQLSYDLDKKKMQLKEPIKNIGTYHVPIRLHPKVTAELKVIVKGK